MLLDPPNFLVLDEPTNHLDLETKEMLVAALRPFEGTMLFVSHDRTFLKGLGTRVLELEYDGEGNGDGGSNGNNPDGNGVRRGARRPRFYPGTYVEYVAATGREAPGIHT